METIDFISFIDNNSGNNNSQATSHATSHATSQATTQATSQVTSQATSQATNDPNNLIFQIGIQGLPITSTPSVTEHTGHRKDMTDVERKVCIEALLHAATNSKLPHGAISKLSRIHGVSRWTLQRLWKHVKHSVALKQSIKITKNQKGKVGRKPIQMNVEQLMAIPLKKRGSIRSVAAAMKINKSTIGRFVKWGKIKRHSNAIKPTLTAVNKIQRLRWCMQQVIPSTINTIPRFGDMYNIVHVDEKWFFMSKETQTFYLAPNEMHPYRHCKFKRFDVKVMFETALSRAIHGPDGQCLFDGKLGIFPLTEVIPEQQSSIHRVADTLETKPIKNITQSVIRKLFIEQLLPSIKAKWPIGACGTIWIQQDNATPHMQLNDIDFNMAANTEGFNIHLIAQPPNSPDLNVLDLGFFRAIQSI